jgi:hypothetical protein
MNYDDYGQPHTTTHDLVDMLYQNPSLDISLFAVTDADAYNHHVTSNYAPFPQVKQYRPLPAGYDIASFDSVMQSRWHMPDEYLELDIARHILQLCTTDAQLQRVGEELLLFQERDLFNLLRYMKYMVDTFIKQDIVWGVGRGSSVSSYVLYLLGVHRIDSMYYDLDIAEFLR